MTTEEERENTVSAQVRMKLWDAERELVLTSPYLIPGPLGIRNFEALGQRNVRMVVLTNSLAATDEPLVHTGYSRYRERLLASGVDLYEISPERTRRNKRLGIFGSSLGRLHAKTSVVDGERVFIGSMNLDPRSETQNTELGIFVDSPELAKELLRIISISKLQSAYRVRLGAAGGLEWLTMDEDNEVILTAEPETSLWLRVHNMLISPFVPEQLL
jgi:putative cardiolipin synthase